MIQIPEVGTRCTTCMTQNPSLVTCVHCREPNMCTMCEAAGICGVCRKGCQDGTVKVEKKEEETGKATGNDKTEAMKLAWEALGRLKQVVPVLVPPLKVLTKLTEKDFDEIFKNLQ